MPEEEKKPEVKTVNNLDVLEEFNKLKENSVSKEEYDKLKAEYNKAVTEFMSGKGDNNNNTQEIVDVKKLRAELLSEDVSMSNYDFVKKTLTLRNAIMENGGDDPFLGRLKDSAPTTADREHAQDVADFLEDLVKRADGSASVFRGLLQDNIR